MLRDALLAVSPKGSAMEVFVLISPNTTLTGSYDYGEVARSILIAIAASYAALDLAGRLTAARGRARAAWLAGGAIAMGIGIWEMHFKGVLAFQLPLPVVYHWPTVLAAFTVAVLASAVALYLVSRPTMGPLEVCYGSLIMGSGIAALHYLNMAAMRLAAESRFDLRIVFLSVALAIIFSLVALTLAFGLREETRGTSWRKIASAIVMGAAISVMHYTGMASASFIASPAVPNLSHTVNITPIANYGVAMITLLVLGGAVVTSSAERRAKEEARRINQGLEQRVAERTRQLTAVNEELRREIAERQRVEGDLRRSEDHMRLVIDTIPALVWSKLPDGSADFLNQRFLEYTGLSVEEGLGEGWLKAIHPDDCASSIDVWREAFAGGKFFELEARLRRADGEYLWLLFRGAPLRDQAGKIVKWYGTSTDIDDRKRAEEESRALIDAIPQQIWSGPPDGSLDYCNLQWRSYMGLTQEDLQGEGWQRMLHPEDRERVLNAWRDSVRMGTPYEQEERHRGADRQYRWFLARGVPLRDTTGRIIRWYGTNTDIEDRKRAEWALQEAQAGLSHVMRVTAMGELVAAIAHEVNQPLAAIVTNANFCLRQFSSATSNSDKLREAISEIVNDGTRASAVISRIRALLQKSAPERVAVDVNQIIQDVTMLLRRELIRSRVSLRTDLGSDLPRVSADRVQLQQVLINLVMNGIEAMRMVSDRPRELLIKSAMHPDGVLVQVQDSGTGFDLKHADRIFEPFFSTKPDGTGMGLSISRSIVESHGGRLWAESGSHGAHFQFTLPSSVS
jgi:PAS domain S-box-containing protein